MAGDAQSGIESEDDVYAWLVREDPDEPRLVFCKNCVDAYIGDGEAKPVTQAMVGDVLYCQNCGADLGNPDWEGDGDGN